MTAAWQLNDALADATVSRIVLSADSSPYTLTHELYANRAVSIEAEEGTEVVLDAAASPSVPRRVLHVGPNGAVNLTRLTLTGAWMPQGSDPGGGAVANLGDLWMTDCVVRHNHAYVGAGIYTAGRVSLRNTAMVNNSAEFVGGAVEISGASAQLMATNCSFQLNSAHYGGALWFDTVPFGSRGA